MDSCTKICQHFSVFVKNEKKETATSHEDLFSARISRQNVFIRVEKYFEQKAKKKKLFQRRFFFCASSSFRDNESPFLCSVEAKTEQGRRNCVACRVVTFFLVIM